MADRFRRLRLATGQLAKLDDARGTVVRVSRGRVWLTQHGDFADHVLDTGDAWAVERDGRTVVAAQADSLVDLSGPGAANAFVAGDEPTRRDRLANWLAATGNLWPARRRVPYF